MINHKRESKGLRIMIKQKKALKREVARIAQEKIDGELNKIDRYVSDIWIILYKLKISRYMYFDYDLVSYWRQNRK